MSITVYIVRYKDEWKNFYFLVLSLLLKNMVFITSIVKTHLKKLLSQSNYDPFKSP